MHHQTDPETISSDHAYNHNSFTHSSVQKLLVMMDGTISRIRMAPGLVMADRKIVYGVPATG